MLLKSSEIHDYSWRISAVLVFFLISSSSMHAFHLLSDQWMDCGNWFWRFSLILQWIAPSSSQCICWEWRKRNVTFFDTTYSEREYFPGSISIRFLLSVGKILGEKPAGSLLCGFAFAFDRHKKSFALNAYYSSWSSGISCSLLFKFITNLFYPWEILTQEWVLSLFKDQILISTPYFSMQIPGCNIVIRAQFWCFTGSILLVVMLLLPLEECIHDKPLHQIVKIMQCLSSWKTVHSRQHSEILHPYRIYSICLVVTASQFVLHIVANTQFF